MFKEIITYCPLDKIFILLINKTIIIPMCIIQRLLIITQPFLPMILMCKFLIGLKKINIENRNKQQKYILKSWIYWVIYRIILNYFDIFLINYITLLNKLKIYHNDHYIIYHIFFVKECISAFNPFLSINIPDICENL